VRNTDGTKKEKDNNNTRKASKHQQAKRQ